MIKAAIFDFDGTLANTMPDLVTALNGTRSHFGYSSITEQDVLRCVNYATPEYVRRSLPEDFDPARLDEAVAVYFSYYEKCYLDRTAPYAGLNALLDRLRSEGVKLAVMTNKDNDHAREMTEKLFPSQFDEVWGTVEGVPVKPNPARAYLIAETFGLKMDEIAFIGDSDVDMATAKNGGMVPVAVSWGYRTVDILRENGARFVADSADMLYDILKSL